MSIHWPLIRMMARRPRRVFYIDDARAYRGAEMLVASLHVAERLAQVSQSRTVGVLMPTSGGFLIACLGAWMLGRTVVPMNYLLSKDELQYVADDCEADAILTVGAMLEYLKGGVPSGKTLVRLDQMNFKSMPDVCWPAGAGDDDLGVLLYTSGTSGKPKGVMLTHGNIAGNIDQIRRWVPFDSREVFLGVLPQFHSFGLTALTLLPAYMGAKAVFTARFVPGKILGLMREHRPSVMIAIPSMYNAMLHAKSAKREDFASLRYVVSGGEPLPSAVFEGFRERFGVTINEGYGLTETSPVSNWCRPQEWRAHSVGRALPDIDQRIVDIETGAYLAAGRDGEVRMKGPNVMRGYFKLQEETAKAFDERGYFRTGDIGRMDEDGHLYITGRLKEMLIVGGENVFPREIEEVLNQHPSVKESGVVGKHDPMRGEVPVAFVEMRPDPAHPEEAKVMMAFEEKALLRWCRERLAGYKVPDEIRVVEALPRNATGKVLRRELKRAIGAGGGAGDRAGGSI